MSLKFENLSDLQAVANTNHENTVYLNDRVFENNQRHIVLPEGFEIESLEHLQPVRYRPRSLFKTRHFADFVTYVKSKAPLFVEGDFVPPYIEKGASAIFVNRSHPVTATAVLDYHEALGHAENTAKFEAQFTDVFAAFFGLTIQNDKPQFSQKQMVQLLENWGDAVALFDDTGEPMSQKEAIASIQTLTVAKAKNIKQTRSDSSFAHTIAEKAELDKQGRVLSGIVITDTVFHGLQGAPRDVEFKVGLAIGEDDFALTLRVVGYDRVLSEKVEEMSEKLAHIDGCQVYIGDFYPHI